MMDEKYSSYPEQLKLRIEKRSEKLLKNKKMLSSSLAWGLLVLGLIFVVSTILYLLVQVNHKSESYNPSEGVFVNQMTGESLNCTISRMTYQTEPPNKILLYCIPMND